MSDEYEPSDEEIEEEEQAARLFYRLDGWERYWPFDKMPDWLRRGRGISLPGEARSAPPKEGASR